MLFTAPIAPRQLAVVAATRQATLAHPWRRADTVSLCTSILRESTQNLRVLRRENDAGLGIRVERDCRAFRPHASVDERCRDSIRPFRFLDAQQPRTALGLCWISIIDGVELVKKHARCCEADVCLKAALLLPAIAKSGIDLTDDRLGI